MDDARQQLHDINRRCGCSIELSMIDQSVESLIRMRIKV